jgi:integration host factor subunit alpha
LFGTIRLIDDVSFPDSGAGMSGKTITRADLWEAVYQKVGLSRTESPRFVELVLKEIADCLERGETVKLSSFGSFVVRKKGQRIGRNPKTGKEVPISARRVMVFKSSAVLSGGSITDSLRQPSTSNKGPMPVPEDYRTSQFPPRHSLRWIQFRSGK